MPDLAYPYRRPSENTVRADAWFIDIGGERRQLDAYVAEWDYNTDVQLSREIAVDVAAARVESGLPSEAPLALIVSWFSRATYLRGTALRRDLDEPTLSATITVRLPGPELAGTISIETRLVLAGAAPTKDEFTAHLPGSILWEQRTETRLQGDAPLFPISVVDFRRAGFPPGAPWKLVIDGNVDSALLGAVRLYVNAEHRIVVDAFQHAVPRPEDERVLSAAYADVARVFLEHALSEHLSIPVEADPESLGYALKMLIERLFPGEAPESVRERRAAQPTDFGADLLARLRLFNE